ncbi:MAG: hypothetical protein JWQ20_1338 [Conexibacter sp.]|nr:hypothetical protein [Conexibacter sp.]
MSETTEPLKAEDGGPFNKSPDIARRNGFVRMLRKTVAKHSLTPLKDYVLVPAPIPSEYATETLADLAGRLATDDPVVAKAVLDEAEAMYKEPAERIESAERRATTLQGVVAVAASVAVASGGLLLDPTKVAGHGWRIAIAAVLLAFVLCLLACALRALGATTRIFRFLQPGHTRIAERARMSETEVLTHRAAELLRAYDVADQVGAVKVGLLRSAAWWFRASLVMLALLMVLLATYTVAGPQPRGTASTTTVTPTAPSPGGHDLDATP